MLREGVNKMDKLTDAEIICALDRLKYGSHTYSDSVTAKNAIELINRQKAEIERYKGVIKILESDVAKTKVETTKEFAKYLIDNDEDGVINTIDLPELVCDFLHPVEKVEHDSLCETETYKAMKERF